MPRPLVDNPSKDTLRKRAQREKDKKNNSSTEAKKKNADYMRLYRAKKREEKKKNEPAKEQEVKSDPIKTLKEIKKEVVIKVSEVVSSVFKNGQENKRDAIEELKNSMPEIKHEIKKISDDAKIKISKDMKMELLTDLLFEHSKKYDKVPNNRKTYKEYLIRLKHFQSMFTGYPVEDVLDFEIYRAVDVVWHFLMNMKSHSGKSKGQELLLSSKNTYIGAISAVLRRIQGFEKEYIEYAKKHKILHNEYEEERKHNKLSNSERERFLKWPQVMEKFYSELKSNKLTLRELSMYGIYTVLPPRRVMDYSLMKVAHNKKKAVDESKLSQEYNYLVLTKSGKPLKMIINKYKTSKRYGTYIRTVIPEKLSNLLTRYIEEYDIKNNEPLFGTIGVEKPQHYSHGGFSRMIGDLFLKVTGKRASINILRHSAITHFLDSKKRTFKEKEDFAKEMGHSVNMQSLYDRVDIDDPIRVSPSKESKDENEEPTSSEESEEEEPEKKEVTTRSGRLVKPRR